MAPACLEVRQIESRVAITGGPSFHVLLECPEGKRKQPRLGGGCLRCAVLCCPVLWVLNMLSLLNLRRAPDCSRARNH